LNKIPIPVACLTAGLASGIRNDNRFLSFLIRRLADEKSFNLISIDPADQIFLSHKLQLFFNILYIQATHRNIQYNNF